jgi:AcrR family transcriptional regulator
MKRRAYDSRLRQAGAARTRRRILQAARKLFARQGFEKTTISRLASEAGVAGPTIYASFQSKGGVLKALIEDSLFGGRYEALVQQAMASNDPRERIRMAATIARTVFDSEKSQTGILRGAAALSRELKAIEKSRERQRFERQAPTIALLFEQRRFARGLDMGRARDVLWTLTSRDLYRMLVLERGWSSDDYEEWLADVLVRTLMRN